MIIHSLYLIQLSKITNIGPFSVILRFVLFQQIDQHVLFIQGICKYLYVIVRDGLIQVFSIEIDESLEDPILLESIHSVITPNAIGYNSSCVDSEFDCILLYNKYIDTSLSPLLIYTSSLELRGMISLGSVHSVYITNYGILVVSSSIIYRFTFCGDPDGSFIIPGSMYKINRWPHT